MDCYIFYLEYLYILFRICRFCLIDMTDFSFLSVALYSPDLCRLLGLQYNYSGLFQNNFRFSKTSLTIHPLNPIYYFAELSNIGSEMLGIKLNHQKAEIFGLDQIPRLISSHFLFRSLDHWPPLHHLYDPQLPVFSL